MEDKKQNDCCGPVTPKNEKNGLLLGILYGIIPHTFCILFVIFSIVGATTGTALLKKTAFFPYMFEILMVLSFGFATLSAVIYLRRQQCLNTEGIKRKWKYLAILYSTTLAINLLFFYLIMPNAAGFKKDKIETNTVVPVSTAVSEDVQIIRMDQLGRGYSPSQFTVKVNRPVRWIITSKSPYSCAASIVAPEFKIEQDLQAGENIIEFTPTKVGQFSFACVMGMYRGKITVTK